MGRAPCCDKAKVKRGPWSPEEDATLKSYIEHHGTAGNWIALPQKIGLKRCGKSCRLRWLNYLRPNLKHGSFSEDEDRIISTLYLTIGSRWSVIAAQLAGRTDNDIKNYWNTKLKKKLLGKHRKDQHYYSGRGNINSTTATTTLKQQQQQQQQHTNSTSTSCVIENTWPHHLPIPQIPYNNCPHIMPYSMSNMSSQDSLRNLLSDHLYQPATSSHPPLPHQDDDDDFMNFQLPLPHASTPPPSSSSTLQLPINYDEQQQLIPMLSSSAASTHNNQYSTTSTTTVDDESHYLLQAAALHSHHPTSSLHQGIDYFSCPQHNNLIHHNITPPTTSSILYPPPLLPNSHSDDSMPLIHFPFQHYSSS